MQTKMTPPLEELIYLANREIQMAQGVIDGVRTGYLPMIEYELGVFHKKIDFYNDILLQINNYNRVGFEDYDIIQFCYYINGKINEVK